MTENLGREKTYLIGFLLMIVTLLPYNSFGETKDTQKEKQVTIKDGRVTASIHGALLPDALKEIENATGTEIIINPAITSRNVTSFFEDLPPESAIQRFLEENRLCAVLNYNLDPMTGQKKLKQVRVNRDVDTVDSNKRMNTIHIPYGSGTKEVGAVNSPGEPGKGPMAFTVDGKGDIFISDSVNSRIQVFSSKGDFKETLSIVEGALPADIGVDEKGFVYVYDARARKLYQHEPDGKLKGAITVDETRWHSRKQIQVVDNMIVMNACSEKECGDVTIGRISKGDSLEPSSASDSRTVKGAGYQATSGRKYRTKQISREQSLMEIKESNGNVSQLSIPLTGLFSAKYIGEDSEGSFYVETGLKESDNKARYEIQRFNSNYDYLDSTIMPLRISEFWSISDYFISKNGDIYKFTPEKDALKIDVFTK